MKKTNEVCLSCLLLSLIIGANFNKGSDQDDLAAETFRNLHYSRELAESKLFTEPGNSSQDLRERAFDEATKQVLANSVELSNKNNSGGGQTEVYHILCAFLDYDKNNPIDKLGWDRESIRNELERLRSKQEQDSSDRLATVTPGGDRGGARAPTLKEYSRDLTAEAQKGNLDPVIGRSQEIERVIQILSRRTKSNPILLGEAGVGKTAIAEGLAQAIANRDVPAGLENRKVYELDMGRLVAGTKYRGEFEDRLKKILEEVKKSKGQIVLVMDEIHTLVGAGAGEGALDAANMLKPALARGEFQCIGATTNDEYQKYFAKDAALDRRFQPVMVEEPAIDDTIEILNGVAPYYEAFHNVKYEPAALREAARLSNQYISDRHLPDKAIGLVDEAGSVVKIRHTRLSPKARQLERELETVRAQREDATVREDFERAAELSERENGIKRELENISSARKELARSTAKRDSSKEEKRGAGLSEDRPVVTVDDIASVLAQATGIPVKKLKQSERQKLAHIDEELRKRVIGQQEAIDAIAKAVRRSAMALSNPNRPIGCFLFCGPTGVGKTELAKALANNLFGSDDAMIRLDMSEYGDKFTASRLTGAPPGYVGYDEGGQLTDPVRRKPYQLVLLDEIEKAHPDVFNVLLQIFEDGRLTDSKGRTANFKNTIIVLTSNLGSKQISQAVQGGGGLGFQTTSAANKTYEAIKELVFDELKVFFKPELLNRLDEVLVFQPLTRDQLAMIADIMLKDVIERAGTQKIDLVVMPKLRDFLIDKGYDPVFGARPLRRAIQVHLENPLADALINGKVSAGMQVVADLQQIRKPDGTLDLVVQMVDKTSYTQQRKDRVLQSVSVSSSDEGEGEETPTPRELTNF